MDITLRERIENSANKAVHSVNLALARGFCANPEAVYAEGSDCMPEIEYSRQAGIDLFLNPPPTMPQEYRDALRRLALSPSQVVRFAVGDAFADVQGIVKLRTNIAGDIVERTVEPLPLRPEFNSTQMTTQEFIISMRKGVAELLANGWKAPKANSTPEAEWMRQQAERESGWLRKSKQPGDSLSLREDAYNHAFARMKSKLTRYKGGRKGTQKPAP